MTTHAFDLGRLDAVRWLQTLPSQSVDLLITDPGLRVAGEAPRRRHDDAAEAQQVVEQRLVPGVPERALRRAVRQAYRVLKRDTHFYLFCDAETMFVAKPEAERPGFKFWKPLVWDKRTIGMGYHYRARYELILFFEKGKRRLNDLGVADVISVPRIRGGYPAEKPPEVSEVLIGQSSQPGEVVADPFMGSGSVGVAALRLGRRFLGNDINPERRAAGARSGCWSWGPGSVTGVPIVEGQPDLLEIADSRP